jgi:hypothetical protein
VDLPPSVNEKNCARKENPEVKVPVTKIQNSSMVVIDAPEEYLR